MLLKVMSAIAVTVCAAQLPAQSIPATPTDVTVMPGHVTEGMPVTMAEWSEHMRKVLAHELHYPMPLLDQRPGFGMVRVKFNCSPNGHPEKVLLLQTSGDFLLDRAAVSAVRRMASLHPLPSGLKPTQKFVALIVFADNASDPRLAMIHREQNAPNKWYHEPATALNTPFPSTPIEVQVAAAY